MAKRMLDAPDVRQAEQIYEKFKGLPKEERYYEPYVHMAFRHVLLDAGEKEWVNELYDSTPYFKTITLEQSLKFGWWRLSQ